SKIPPRGGLAPILRSRSRLAAAGPVPVASYLEDSHSGLVRSLGKRVGLTPSGVRIPYPPPNGPDEDTLRDSARQVARLSRVSGRREPAITTCLQLPRGCHRP